eukprot:gene9213-12424_t
MNSVNLSQRTTSQLSSIDSIGPENLSKICKYFFQSLIRGGSNIVIDESLDEYLCAISTLMIEAARSRITSDQIRSVLKEQGCSVGVIDIISGLYEQHTSTIIEHIEDTGIAAPEIIGIDWRLDYSIRSKNAGRENLPMFFIALKVKDRGIIRDIDMIATLEELQDLLSKVRDAVKQADRIVTMNET